MHSRNTQVVARGCRAGSCKCQDRARNSIAGCGSTGSGTLQSPEAVPQIGAWAEFSSNGLLDKHLGSAITAHGPWKRGSGVGARGRHRCLLVQMARISKRLRFYEDAAKVVQRRMVLNFKKSFERAVRTVRR